jgi:hypothetical protein
LETKRPDNMVGEECSREDEGDMSADEEDDEEVSLALIQIHTHSLTHTHISTLSHYRRLRRLITTTWWERTLMKMKVMSMKMKMTRRR